MSRYEYDFVRLSFGLLKWGQGKVEKRYRQVIQAHAKRGWRLVQVFAPPTSVFGHAQFYEMIFERPLSEETAAEEGSEGLDG